MNTSILQFIFLRLATLNQERVHEFLKVDESLEIKVLNNDFKMH